MRYSDKQIELLRLFKKRQLKRLNILHGSVRSGKTWISLVLWGFWLLTMPRDKNYLMAAKTLTSLKRNCLELLVELFGSNFTYSIPAKEAVLFGRKIHLEGANDARAETKIRGMTLAGAYCDELTLFTEDFFVMLLSRLSESGAKLFGTTNPDTPMHWFKTGYIDRQAELDMLVMSFLIDDNPYLDRDYVENLKREYTGVFYDRYILGLWVKAEGLVYPMFDRDRHVVKSEDIPEKGAYFISVDYGTVNPFSAGLWCICADKAYRIAEYYHDGRKKGRQMTDEEYYAEIEKLAGDLPIQYIIVDPSAASFITCIRRHGRFGVRRARNEVLDGIRITAGYLQSGSLLISEVCQDAIREFGLYGWNESEGPDRPIKENDHAMDDIRYFCMTELRKWVVW